MLDTTLEAAGSEHLVIGRLLIGGIQAFRAQANQRGYDILALNRSGTKSARIQVKSRAAIDAGAVRFRSDQFDFAVIVRLNLGLQIDLISGNGSSDLQPAFFVVAPEHLTFKGQRARLGPSKLIAEHRDAWHRISNFLDS